MVSIKETALYSEVLKELNYSFGNVFIFHGVVVSEINRGTNFNWNDHGQTIVDDISCYLGTDGNNIVYISHRIHPYALVAVDWLKFFKYNYYLKGYYVVSDSPSSKLNLMVESLFFKNKIKHFQSISEALNCARSVCVDVA